MPRNVLAVTAAAVFIVFVLLQAEFADANPSWGEPATPIPPITDPPEIIINFPSPIVNSNPVHLNITIIQPDSWMTNISSTLPRFYEDNSDSVVVGRNKLKSVECVIDGVSITLWNGTNFGPGITDYLPKITSFSAELSLSKGPHTLQINVNAVSEYSVEGIIPFAGREHPISANQSTTFYLTNGIYSGLQTIYNIKSSYEIWHQNSNLMTTPGPTQFLETASNPTATPNIPEFPWCFGVMVLGLIVSGFAAVYRKKRKSEALWVVKAAD